VGSLVGKVGGVGIFGGVDQMEGIIFFECR